MIELAIIIITKNQAWNVQRLLESVLKGTIGVSSREIFVVDSASTDSTVQVAMRYPINIVRLPPGPLLTPAAGRYVGCKLSVSRYILFLDGDMEIHSGWLERALRVFAEGPSIAAVTGRVVDLPVLCSGQGSPDGADPADADVRDVAYCGGAALYRRAAFDDVGTFNPYLYAEEEPDLCLRLRDKGYRIRELACPMVNHYTEPSNDTFGGVISRRRRKFYLGFGQNLRYYFGTRLLFRFLLWRGFALIPAVALGIALFSLLWSLTTRQWYWFELWCLFVAVVAGIDAIRKRSLYQTGVSLMKRLFSIEGACRGLLLSPLGPETYPLSFDVVQRSSANDAT